MYVCWYEMCTSFLSFFWFILDDDVDDEDDDDDVGWLDDE